MGKEKNKIKFGLKNTHYAIITETEQEDGTIKSTYSTPKKWPGAVSLSLDPSGESNTFYADDTAYAVLSSNSGYEGDFESAVVPEDVETEVMGQEEVDGVLVESSTDVQKYIALLFEFNGDKKARRHVLYRCSLTRHSVASQTKEDSTEPVTESVTITATPRPDVDNINGKEKNLVKATTGSNTKDETYKNWFTKVWVPTTAEQTEVAG